MAELAFLVWKCETWVRCKQHKSITQTKSLASIFLHIYLAKAFCSFQNDITILSLYIALSAYLSTECSSTAKVIRFSITLRSNYHFCCKLYSLALILASGDIWNSLQAQIYLDFIALKSHKFCIYQSEAFTHTLCTLQADLTVLLVALHNSTLLGHFNFSLLAQLWGLIVSE